MSENPIRVERVLDAPIDAVFAVLDDFDRYPEWNTFTERVVTRRVVGGPVELHVNMPGGKKRVMSETFTGYEKGKRMSWGLKWGFGILLDCDRIQELESLPDGRTKYVTYEGFSGLLAPVVVKFFGGQVRRGFELCANDLAKRMENR